MKLLFFSASAISLLTAITSVFGQAEQRPKLPDEYAEVVLRVEGMT